MWRVALAASFVWWKVQLKLGIMCGHVLHHAQKGVGLLRDECALAHCHMPWRSDIGSMAIDSVQAIYGNTSWCWVGCCNALRVQVESRERVAYCLQLLRYVALHGLEDGGRKVGMAY